ncbi:globin [Halarcobacter sp.]|uniref:globin domain-containing protein n=1 Tax=Halarcobacter sp. TaxID=2321133 RepID=UPI002AA62942|nr:globin [Halarcobacter sp.]
MQYNITEAVFGQRPNVELPNPKILEFLGEDGMRNMVARHYDLLAQSEIKELFPSTVEGLEMAKKHAADFFIQICGGPKYFNESRGAPKMVARHMPFEIDSNARIVWLEKYAQAMEETNLSDELKNSFWNYINIFSIWMINKAS